MGFTPLCFLEIQIEPVLKQSEKISLSLRTKFLMG
jgi:hypothetical protein